MTSLVSNLDFNHRPDPVLSDMSFFSSDTLKRLANVAIPFLSLHQRMATLISLTSSMGQVYHHLKEDNPDLKKIAFLVTGITLSFFNPMLALFLTHGSPLILDIFSVHEDLLNGKYDVLLNRGQEMVSTLLYMASAYSGTSLLLTASLFFQALKEFQDAFSEYKKGRYLETAGKLLMGLIRSGKTHRKFHQFYREKFGKEMTQSDWDWVEEELKERVKKSKKDKTELFYQTFITKKAWDLIWHGRMYRFNYDDSLDAIVDQHHFKREIKGITLNQISFKEMIVRDLSFIDCNMGNVDFENAILENVYFNRCMMQQANFINTLMKNIWILQCDLFQTTFFQAKLEDCIFLNSELSYAAFNDSVIKGVHIIASKLFSANFLGADVQRSMIRICDLRDVLLADAKELFTYQDCTENQFTRPVIALGWYFTGWSWASDVNDALEDHDVLVLKHPSNLPGVCKDKLHKEVKEGIGSYQGNGESIPQHLMRNHQWGSEIKKISKRAQFIAQYADGVIIPGGADVEEEFYKPKAFIGDFQDYRKSIMEYSLIHAFVDTEKKPLMGICRGAQITNTYFPGGTIKEVPNQFGVQSLEFEENRAGQHLKEVLGPEFSASSAHFQAVDQVGEGLEVALKVDGVIKALISEEHKVLLTQFHPEHYLAAKMLFNNLEKNKNEALQEFVFMGIDDMYEEDRQTFLPTFFLNGTGELVLDQESCECWFYRFEHAVNQAFKKIAQLASNNTLISYFLSHTTSHLDVTSIA